VPARNMCLVDLHVPTSHKSLELNPDLRSLAATLQQHKKFTAEVWNKSCGSVAAQSDLDYAELAGLLQDVASDGSDAFYTGDVADDIVAKVSNLADLTLIVCFHVSLLLITSRVYFRPLKKGVVLPLAIVKYG